MRCHRHRRWIRLPLNLAHPPKKPCLFREVAGFDAVAGELVVEGAAGEPEGDRDFCRGVMVATQHFMVHNDCAGQ